jgi:hypothetical protein
MRWQCPERKLWSNGGKKGRDRLWEARNFRVYSVDTFIYARTSGEQRRKREYLRKTSFEPYEQSQGTSLGRRRPEAPLSGAESLLKRGESKYRYK